MRAFIAIDLPEDIKSSILQIGEEMPDHNLTFVRKEALHITIHFFASISEIQASKVIGIISTMHPGKFKVSISGLSYFGEESIRIVFAKVSDPEGQISKLYEDIGKLLTEQKISFDRKKDFVPHITIARCKRKSSPQLKRFIEKHSYDELGRFEISKISLKQSVLEHQVHVYATLLDHEI